MGIAEYSWDAPYSLKWLVMSEDIEAAQIILAGAEAKLKKLEKGDR